MKDAKFVGKTEVKEFSGAKGRGLFFSRKNRQASAMISSAAAITSSVRAVFGSIFW